MTTAKEVDSNGFLLVRGCPISSFGIFDYSAAQLGLGGDPMRIVKVYRPEEAVNDPEAIESFKNVPFINDHEMLSGFEGDENATAPEEYGIDGVLTSNVYYEAPWMKGDLKVFSRKLQDEMDKGKKDLSLGYSCSFELKSGVFDGQAYEAIQTRLRGNHIALVGEGRVAGARVLDGLCFDHLRFDVIPSDNKEHVMKHKAKRTAAMDSAVAQLKALLPALEQYLNEEAQEPIHQENPEGEAEQNTDTSMEIQADPVQENNNGGAEDLPALIQSVEAVLGQLKGMMAGAEKGEGNDEGATNTENSGHESAPTSDGEAAIAAKGAPATEAEAAELSKKASDAALSRFYADVAAKTSIYDRLSKVVGAFDHAVMDSRQIAAYGVKKLGIKCDPSMASVALDAYLNATEAAQKQTKQKVSAQVADNAVANTELDAYLKGN